MFAVCVAVQNCDRQALCPWRLLSGFASLQSRSCAAIVARNPKLPALEFYTEGAAAVAAYNWVKGYTDSGLTVTGTVRYYNRNVKVKSKTSAAIGYCADETKGYDKVVKTGKLKGTTASENSYVAYVGNLSLNKDGIWELTDLVGTRGAASCQP